MRNFSGSRKTPWRKRVAEKRESSRKSPCKETAAGTRRQLPYRYLCRELFSERRQQADAGSYRNTGTCVESSSPRSTHLCVTALPASLRAQPTRASLRSLPLSALNPPVRHCAPCLSPRSTHPCVTSLPASLRAQPTCASLRSLPLSALNPQRESG
jgi:hypothetical protein